MDDHQQIGFLDILFVAWVLLVSPLLILMMIVSYIFTLILLLVLGLALICQELAILERAYYRRR